LFLGIQEGLEKLKLSLSLTLPELVAVVVVEQQRRVERKNDKIVAFKFIN
jgi:hypothetical protein